MKELEKRGITAASSIDLMEVEHISAVYGQDEAMQHKETTSQMPDYTLLSNLTLPLSNLLPSSPAFCHEYDFQQAYQKELIHIGKSAAKVLQGKLKFFNGFSEPIGRHDIVAVDDAQQVVFQQLLDIDTDLLSNYHSSVIALRNLLICALQLMAHGCIVPQIYHDLVTIEGRKREPSTEEKEYCIVWQPALIDEATRSIVNRLGQDEKLLCKIISNLVPLLSHEYLNDQLLAMFFNAERYFFKAIGETNTPGGIRSWLDRFFMQNKHQVTFLINETDDGFAVDVLTDNVPLHDVMTEKTFASSRMEILRQLGILCDIVDGLDNYINGNGRHSILFPCPVSRISVSGDTCHTLARCERHHAKGIADAHPPSGFGEAEVEIERVKRIPLHGRFALLRLASGCGRRVSLARGIRRIARPCQRPLAFQGTVCLYRRG